MVINNSPLLTFKSVLTRLKNDIVSIALANHLDLLLSEEKGRELALCHCIDWE